MSKVVRLTYPCGCQLSIEFNEKMQFRTLNNAIFCPKHVMDIRRQVMYQ